MMNESEFAQFELANSTAVRGIKAYRERHGVGLGKTPLARFYRPVRALYRRLSHHAGLKAPRVDIHHLRLHRLADYGPPCENCRLPLRTPEATICAACGARRAA